MNLLNRAKRLLAGQGPAGSQKTQYFNILCPEGHRMSGVRNEGYQALRCPSCGEGVFVLPRSPLPEVAAVSRPSPQPQARRREPEPDPVAALDEPIALTDPPPLLPRDENEEFSEIEWEEAEPEPPLRSETRAAPATQEPPRAPRPADRPAQPAKAATAPAMRPAAAPRPASRPAAAAARTPEVAAEPSIPFRDWVRRRRNPLIFTAVAAVLAATVGLRQWRARMEDYPRWAEVWRTAGIAALEAGEWDKAHQLLARAKRAVDALGGKVEGTDAIRHAADEAALYASRVPDSLEQLLKAADPSDTSDWPREFANLYQGKAVVVQARVLAVPETDGAGEYDLDYRVFPDGEGDLDRRRDVRVARFDLAGFKLFADLQPKKGTDITFGARLRSFSFDPQRSEWLIGLEPDSGVILQNQKAIAAALMIGSPDSAREEGKP